MNSFPNTSIVSTAFRRGRGCNLEGTAPLPLQREYEAFSYICRPAPSVILFL